MKLKYLAIALFPLALAACESNGIQKTGDSTVSVVEQQNVNKNQPRRAYNGYRIHCFRRKT